MSENQNGHGEPLSKPEALVLHAVSTLEVATRRSIAESTSMSLVTVSSALNSLETRSILAHEAKSKEGGGRPTHYYSFDPRAGSFLGASINTDTFRIVLVDADASQSLDQSFPLSLSDDPAVHADEIVEQVAAAVESTKQSVDKSIVGAGITLPGVTDSENGVWIEGFQVAGVSHVNIRDPFEQATGLPICIEDPARAAAFYELKMGLGRGYENFMLIYLGSGVGSGIVIDGQLYRGCDGLSGEIGHVVVDPTGFRCSCGDVGCFETVASSSGIRRIVEQRLQEGVVSALGRGKDPETGLTIGEVLEAFSAGDRLAVSVLHEVADHVAHVCAVAIKLLNPHVLIISGEASVLHGAMKDRIVSSVRNRVIPSLLRNCTIEFADYHVHDEALGVALYAAESHWARKAAEFGSATP